VSNELLDKLPFVLAYVTSAISLFYYFLTIFVVTPLGVWNVIRTIEIEYREIYRARCHTKQLWL